MGKKNLPKSNPQPTKPHRETVALADLIPHPDQVRVKPHGEFEYQALKRDIKDSGLQTPIEVLPAGNAAGLPGLTILRGHTRRRILIELGLESTEVLMRYDLLGATRLAVEKVFLVDNAARRQNDRLEQARVAVRLFVIERAEKGRTEHNPLQRQEVRDRVGAILGMSGRNLSRYLNVLAAPDEVQAAFGAGAITLVMAARVSSLSAAEQSILASRLSDGEDPQAVLNSYLTPKAKQRHAKPSDALRSFARSIEAARVDLEDRVASVPAGHVYQNRGTLRKGTKLLRALLNMLETYVPVPSIRDSLQKPVSESSVAETH